MGDARVLAAEALKHVRADQFMEAFGSLVGVLPLVEGDESGEARRAVAGVLGEIDAECAAIVGLGGAGSGMTTPEADVVRLQAGLRLRHVVARAGGAPPEEQLGFLKRMVALVDTSFSVSRFYEEWAQLERGLVFARADRLAEAAEAFDVLISRVGQEPEPNADTMLHAFYFKVHALYAGRRWAETVVACESFLSRYRSAQELELGSRRMVAEVMGILSHATFEASLARTGERGEEGMRLLDAVLEELRGKSEPELRAELAHWLVHKLWALREIDEVDSGMAVLEELVRLLDGLDDPYVTRETTGEILAYVGWLSGVGGPELQRLQDARVRSARQERAPRREETGLSEASLGRLDRLSSALMRLEFLLLVDQNRDEDTKKLRARTLIYAWIVFCRSGRAAKKERSILGELEDLGKAAVAACDEMLAEIADAETDDSVDSRSLGPLTIKAYVLGSMGELDAASTIYTDVIDRFSDSDDPYTNAVVQLARNANEELEKSQVKRRSRLAGRFASRNSRDHQR